MTRAAPQGVALAVALALSAAPAAAEERRRPARPWYAPDRMSLQFAGQVGVVAPGVGYALGSERLHFDQFVGFVPAAVAGRDLWSTTGKLSFTPFDLPAGRRWRIQPLVAGMQLTYTFGSRYFVTDDYYKIPTALHPALRAGGGASHPVGRGGGALGVYWEVVALGKMLQAWSGNRHTLGVREVTSLALGAWLRF